MNSCIYEGVIRHRRMSPAKLSFRYSLFMMYLDLDELPGLFRDKWLWSSERFNLAWFRRKDHLGDSQVPLDRAVRDLVEQHVGIRPEGSIRLLTHLRYFGYCFNPVSFYFCFDPTGEHVEVIVAEVHNTPWGEQHCYVLGENLNEALGTRKRFRFPKAFHVSPFMDMDVGYDWRFSQPGSRLAVHMENVKAGRRFFDATLALRRREITGRSLAGVLTRYPFMTGTVIAGIYYQAWRLWLHRCPFYAHPRKEASGQAPRRGYS